MKVVEILRVEESEEGTIGVMRIEKVMFCVTMERPDFLNAPNVSSIPTGQYICKRYGSQKYPNTFEVTGVPERFVILLHAGNTIEDTEGCIIVAEKQGKLRGNRAILNSGKTFTNFMGLMHGEKEFHLTITEHY